MTKLLKSRMTRTRASSSRLGFHTPATAEDYT